MPESPEFAWSTDIDADVVTICETILAAGDPAVVDAPVTAGPAVKGTQPPFVVCWPLAPEQTGDGLAAESWGVAHQAWQVTPHGVDPAQARYLAEQMCDASLWPSGWELREIGPFAPDTTDTPETWFVPLTFVYTVKA